MASPDDKKPSMKPGAHSGDQAPPAEADQVERGRHASKPTEIPSPGWWDILRRTFKRLGEDNLSIVAAGIAFYAFTAMVPALAATIAIYALVADPATVTGHIEALTQVLPQEARPLLHDQLIRLASNTHAAGWSAVLGIGVALFGAMKAMTAIITGLNITYGETEHRGLVRLNLTAFVLTLAGVLGGLLAIALVAVIPALLHWLGSEIVQTVFNVLRWPLLAALFIFALAVAYRYAACRDKPRWHWVTWGAAVATVSWLLGSAAFSLYVSKFGNYQNTYGSLGAVVVFLIWMDLTAYVILLGAELDSEMERQTVKDTTVGPEQPMGQRGAHAADTLGPSQQKKAA